MVNSAADFNCRTLASGPATASAMASTLTKVKGSSRHGPDKPCRYALRLDANLPARVLGPVLRMALARLAAICFSLAMFYHSPLLLFDQLGIRILRTGLF